MIRYFGTISFLKIITALLLMSDATYFHNVHITYFNFAHTIWVPVLMAITWPCEESTRHRPMCNLLSAHNHVIYWANIIFPTIGFIAGYFYFTNTTAFIKNPSPVVDPSKGYHTVNDTATIVWLMINIPLILNAFLVYTSEPFKVRFFRNIPLLVLVTANLAAAIAFFFTTSSLLYKLALLPIPVDNAGIVLAIMLSAMLLSFFFSRFVESRSTHRINPEELPLSTMTNLMTEQ